ncbi:hypothetical protein SAMN05216226_103187 [Halovenus aranensis]|jgi:hypothetical protein|uniref:ABC-2 type transport system permease protein n=1 Tax=Halovenus aranensis TaxID=890420 RepID=A0A1G8TS94_9EURY|nr:hypothetical protein [Halovenus aranensis]SDJ43570.1 hypothetical protein SAMN05216226_103187 [Halovenus aranensis]
MFERWHRPGIETDREYLLRFGALPALATIVAMAVCFGAVAGVLFVRDGLIVDSVVTQVIALVVMYVVPLFVVGLWTGVRDGLAAAPALAASTTPIVVFVLALAAFGGPVLTAVESPLLVVGAVVFWSLVCGVGNVVGATVLGPRLRG